MEGIRMKLFFNSIENSGSIVSGFGAYKAFSEIKFSRFLHSLSQKKYTLNNKNNVERCNFLLSKYFSTESNPINTSELPKYKKLFSPMNIGNVEIKNRVVQTAMGVDICSHDGLVTDRCIAYYRERAKNGVGLIITEYTRINEKDGVSAVGQMSLASDRHIPGVKKLVEAVHEENSKIFIQIQHPGRQTIPIFPTIWPTLERVGKIFPRFWESYERIIAKATEGGIRISSEKDMKRKQFFLKPNLAPSKIPENEPDVGLSFVKHRAMTIKEIHKIENQFIQAAIRAKKAGADGVELHATHGYLLQQFLSPFTNRRTDEYGGSLENRCRIIKNIIRAIKKECGKEFPVVVRMTVDEFEEKIGHPERGYHVDEGIRIAKEFENYGVDAIDVSVGSTDTSFLCIESMRYPLNWRKDYIKAIKDNVSIPVIGVNVIRTPSQAEELLLDNVEDFIGLGRSLLVDSQWVIKAKENRENEISRCISCLCCMESLNMLSTSLFKCSLNPRVLKEIDIPETPIKNGHGRKVVIVGAGPAGVMAARELAIRGFKVILFEKEEKEGGQLNLANKPPMKERILWAAQDLKTQAEKAGVILRFGEEATVQKIKELNPDYAIIATGSYAIHPKIPGSDEDYVCTSTPVLKGEICPKDKNVVVIGSGLTGLDTSELLIANNNKVTVVDKSDTIAPGASNVSLQELVPLLKLHNVKFLLGHTLKMIKDHHVILINKDGNKKCIPADYVVLSVGVKSDDNLAKQLENTSIPVFKIGDADKPGRIVNATHQAFITARNLK